MLRRYGFAIAVCVTSALVFAEESTAPIDPEEWKLARHGVRPIDVPQRSSIYRGATPTLIESESQLANYIETLGANARVRNAGIRVSIDNARSKLRESMGNAGIDFSRELIVMLPATFGSGSINAWLSEPALNGDSLQVGVSHDQPTFKTMDMAFRLFALRVPRLLVTSIRVTGEPSLRPSVTLLIDPER